MFSFSRYKKKDLPLGLIRLHEVLLEDVIGYFEKGKFTRKKIKESLELEIESPCEKEIYS